MLSVYYVNTLQSHILQAGYEKICSELEYAFSRLMQGLGSGRKQVKLGFATTLTKLLINLPTELMSSQKFLYLLNDQLALPQLRSASTVSDRL